MPSIDHEKDRKLQKIHLSSDVFSDGVDFSRSNTTCKKYMRVLARESAGSRRRGWVIENLTRLSSVGAGSEPLFDFHRIHILSATSTDGSSARALLVDAFHPELLSGRQFVVDCNGC